MPHATASPASASATGIVTRPAGANTLSTWYGVRVTDGTFAMPAMDATTRRGYVAITDGANQMPTMDVVARKGFFQLTDGVSAAAVKAASTAAAAADPALVVALSPNSGVVGAQATGAKQTAAPLVIGGADEQGLARTASVVQRNGSTPLRTYDEDNRALLEQAVMLLTDIRTVLVHLLPAGANPSLSGLSEN